MKKLITLLLLSPLAFAETLPLCKDTLLYWVNYFDDCRTAKYEWNGFTYSGEWRKNKYHSSLAVLTQIKSGASHMGEFINGEKHGKFFTTFTDGTSMMASFNHGKYVDKSTIAFANPDSLPNTSYSQPLPSTGSSSSDGSFLAEMGASLLGGNKSSSSSSTSKPINSNRTYSSSLTVPSNQLCPMLASPVVKQEVVRGNRICYYQ